MTDGIANSVRDMQRLLLAALLLAVTQARAQDLEIHGRTLVETNCSGCHAVGRDGASPHVDAPAFRTLHQRYPVESLAEALAEGISTGHPDMPEFVASPEQVDAIITYIGSLEPR